MHFSEFYYFIFQCCLVGYTNSLLINVYLLWFPLRQRALRHRQPPLPRSLKHKHVAECLCTECLRLNLDRMSSQAAYTGPHSVTVLGLAVAARGSREPRTFGWVDHCITAKHCRRHWNDVTESRFVPHPTILAWGPLYVTIQTSLLVPQPSRNNIETGGRQYTVCLLFCGDLPARSPMIAHLLASAAKTFTAIPWRSVPAFSNHSSLRWKAVDLFRNCPAAFVFGQSKKPTEDLRAYAGYI